MRRVLTAGLIGGAFSFHAISGSRSRSVSADTSLVSFPKAERLPRSVTEWAGMAHVVGVTLPVLASTYFWASVRATENSLVPRKIAIRCTAALAFMMVFDGASWLYRLRTFGTKRAYTLVEQRPELVSRPQTDEEVRSYRINQVLLPSVLVIGGQLSGLCPFMFVPVLTWKTFWHFWVLYQTETVLTELGVGSMAPFRELESREGHEVALSAFCAYKHLVVSPEAEALYLEVVQK
jgi:hypothetical protein